LLGRDRWGRWGATVGAFVATCGLPAAAHAATSFGDERFYETSAAADVASGDVDGDGALDLVGADFGELAVLLGNGDGTFDLSEQPILANNDTRQLILADVNQDTSLDVIFTDPFEDEVIVMTGDGSGSFAISERIAFSGTPSGVQSGEFGGGAKPDLAVTDIEDDEVTLLLQGDDGAFTTGPSFTVGEEPHQVAAADLDGNGRRDLVVSNRISDTLTVLLQETGGFGSPSSHDVGDGPTGVEIADVDGDGTRDIVAATTTRTSVLLASSPGTFAEYEEHDANAYVHTVETDDLDDDGDVDLVTTGGSPAVRAMLQEPDGSFESVAAGDFSSYIIYGTAIGDFDGDDEVDFVASDALNGFHVLHGEVLRVEPPWVEFGPTWGGRVDPNGSFAVRNTGSGPMTVDEVAFDGAAGPFSLQAGPCVGVELAVRETCQVGVTVHAPTDVNAILTAWIQVRAGGLVKRVWADADVYQPGDLQAEPTSVDFGAVPAGAVSEPRTIVVRNPGASTVTTAGISVTGPFRVIANGCSNRVMWPSATCQITAEFAPTSSTRASGQIALWGREALSDLSAYLSIPLRGGPQGVIRAPRPRLRVVPEPSLDRAALRRQLLAIVDRLPRLLAGVPKTKRFLPSFKAPEAGELTLTLRARKGKHRLILARAKVRADKDAYRRLSFKLSRRERSILNGGSSRIHSRLAFRPGAQPSVSVNRRFTLNPPRR